MKIAIVLIALLAVGSHTRAATVSTGRSNVMETTEQNLFAANMYEAVAVDNLQQDVVISPASIQTSLALAFIGAKGRTATELQTALRLGQLKDDVMHEDVARRFGDFQQTFTRTNNLRLVNNIYINENLEFKARFRDLAQRSFDSNVEKADFHPPYNKRTAERISKEVQAKTDGKVADIIGPQRLNDLTEGIIVNGISYSAPWQNAFKVDKTSKRDFLAGGRQNVKVETMWTINNFRYGEFAELDAKVVELPYQNADFAMLVVLPNKNNGLGELIQTLSKKNLIALVDSGFSTEKLEVYLPKFSVTFGVSLQEPLRKLGVTTMFTREGDFDQLYRMFVSHYINSADHKAHVEVSEDGANSPLESGSLLTGIKTLLTRTKTFEANHPFVFAIRHKDSIIFMGHVTYNV